MIRRFLQDRLSGWLRPGKAALLFGPRRVGKTMLIREIIASWPGTTMLLNGEDFDTHALLEQRSAANYRRVLEGVDLFALDEAQNVPGIGLKLKLMVDEVPHVRILASGSSAYDLFNKAGEPLVGRSAVFRLFPFTRRELAQRENALETRQNLEDRLVYGSYPEVVLLERYEHKVEYLKELVGAYLLKDILSYEGIRHSGKLMKLLQLVAFQMGSEVSLEELASQLGISKNTVEKYLDLLASVYIIYRLGAYAGNLRKEVTRAGKWYFYDTGIRNAIIGNFNPPALRQDTGFLWEAYCLGERIKNGYHEGTGREYFFWRTYDGQEIDLVEKKGDVLSAYEFKWQNKAARIPAAFAKAYPGAAFQEINRDNYLDFTG